LGQAQIALRPGQWRKCRTPSRAPLRNGAAVRRSRLKIATDAAGILGPFVLIGVRGEINSGRRGTWSSGERDGANGENASPWWRYSDPSFYSGAPGWILLWQASAERFQALVAVAVDLSSFVGSRTPRQADTHTQHQPNIVTLLRPRAGGLPTYCCLSDHVNYKLQGCLNVLGASAIRSARHFQANNCWKGGPPIMPSVMH
jgi:hypothetical protein